MIDDLAFFTLPLLRKQTPPSSPLPEKTAKKKKTHCARLSDRSSPCDRRTCTCPWAASPTRGAFPLAIARSISSSSPLFFHPRTTRSAAGMRTRLRLLCPPFEAVCAGALSAAPTSARGFSCEMVRGQKGFLGGEGKGGEGWILGKGGTIVRERMDLPEETTGQHRGGSEWARHCAQLSIGMVV